LIPLGKRLLTKRRLNISKILLVVIPLLSIFSCASNSVNNPPDWYVNTTILERKHPELIIGYGKAELLHEERAIQFAMSRARADISTKIGSETLYRTVLLEEGVLKSEGGYTAFVAIGMDKSDLNKTP